jgi:hypothetical protein
MIGGETFCVVRAQQKRRCLTRRAIRNQLTARSSVNQSTPEDEDRLTPACWEWFWFSLHRAELDFPRCSKCNHIPLHICRRALASAVSQQQQATLKPYDL